MLRKKGLPVVNRILPDTTNSSIKAYFTHQTNPVCYVPGTRYQACAYLASTNIAVPRLEPPPGFFPVFFFGFSTKNNRLFRLFCRIGEKTVFGSFRLFARKFGQNEKGKFIQSVFRLFRLLIVEKIGSNSQKSARSHKKWAFAVWGEGSISGHHQKRALPISQEDVRNPQCCYGESTSTACSPGTILVFFFVFLFSMLLSAWIDTIFLSLHSNSFLS